ncbi:hypothetical protein INT47_006297, partial [Mucor saturninus]
TIIKRFDLPENERFDIVAQADLNFVETMGNHFPSNPLLQPTLERTAAIHTTIALLNKLFLSVNDKINFDWIEIETLSTQSTKWNGVGFRAGSDQKIGFCLVEFSGGIKKNCTLKKAGSDIYQTITGHSLSLDFANRPYEDTWAIRDATTHQQEKIEKGIIGFTAYTNAVKGHFIRLHAMKLYFELVFLVENRLIRRTHATVKLPATPSELKVFFNQTQSLFTWKKSLTDTIDNV